MKNALRSLLLLTLAATPVLAQESASPETAKPSFTATSKLTRYATVLSVDTATRIVVYRSQEGDTIALPVKPEVKTLAQLKPGDRIKAVYTENLNIRVEEGGDTDATVERIRSDAKPGENPAMSVMERMTYRATIAAIHLDKGTAMLKDPGGEEFEVTPLEPENLKRVKVGDVVVVTATQSMALSLDKDDSKKSEKKPAKKK